MESPRAMDSPRGMSSSPRAMESPRAMDSPRGMSSARSMESRGSSMSSHQANSTAGTQCSVSGGESAADPPPAEWNSFLSQLTKDVKAAADDPELVPRLKLPEVESDDDDQQSEDKKHASSQVRKILGLAEPSKEDMDEALIRLIKAEMAGDTPHEADAELVRDLQAEHKGRAPPPIPAELYKVLPDTPRELKGGVPMTMLAGALQSSLQGDLRVCAPRPRAVPKKKEIVPLKSYMEKGFDDEAAPTGGCTRMRCVNNSMVYQLDKDELEELFETAIEEVNDGSAWSHTSQSAMCRAVQVVGKKLALDTISMKKLFSVVKTHSETTTSSSPLQQSRRFLEQPGAQRRIGPQVLKRRIINSREALIEDFSEVLHAEDEIARLGGNPPPAPSRAQRKRAKALFKIIDINSDGTLDIDELSAAFSDDWKRRGLHTMLIDEAKETNSEGVGIAEWTKFTKRLVKEQGPGFMNHFLTEMLQDHLPPLDGEEQRGGLMAFGAMDGDISGTLDVEEIHVVFDECFPEYLTSRPQSLVRVEKGCIDATMWLLFLREIKNFEGPEALCSVIEHINDYKYDYNSEKSALYKDFTGPLFASALLVCMDYANAVANPV